MPSFEKGRFPSGDDTNPFAPSDLPPSYETTILPNTNPWTTEEDRLPSPQLIPTHQPEEPTPQRPSQPPRPTASITVPSQNPLHAFTRLSKLVFARYHPPSSTLSEDLTTVTTSAPELTGTSSTNGDIKALRRNIANFLIEQAGLPPKVTMLVRGTHTRAATVVDFELKFNLSCLLDLGSDDDGVQGEDEAGSVPESSSRTVHGRSGGRFRVQPFQDSLSGGGTPTRLTREERNLSELDIWVKRFCEDKTESRSLILTRTLSPTLSKTFHHLEGSIRTLLAMTHYRGRLSVDFTTQYQTIVIQKKSSNWLASLGTLLRLVPEKRFEVGFVEWDGAGRRRGRAGSEDGEIVDEGRRWDKNMSPSFSSSNTAPSLRVASNSAQLSKTAPSRDHSSHAAQLAQAWWQEWHIPLRNGVLSGHRGWVSVEEWMQGRMGVRVKERGEDWGVDYE